MNHKSNHTNKTFFTSILRNLQKGDAEYIFSKKQIEVIQEMLDEDEHLCVTEFDGYYLISLKRKEKTE